jgi:hypothetical protein
MMVAARNVTLERGVQSPVSGASAMARARRRCERGLGRRLAGGNLICYIKTFVRHGIASMHGARL